jgi:hypothetical protein
MVNLWITQGKEMNLVKPNAIHCYYPQSYTRKKYHISKALGLVPNGIPGYNILLTTT